MKLGANLIENNKGCNFKVWAPFACSVSVIGDFNNWGRSTQNKMIKDNEGIWSVDIPEAGADQKYKYQIKGPAWNNDVFEKPDPWAREMEHSAGASIIKDSRSFKWTDQDWTPPLFEKMVIYELHVSTFIGKNDDQEYPGDFFKLKNKLDYIKSLGANTIELLPIHEYAGDDYLGYAPVAFFPVEHSYGTSEGKAYDDFKDFVNAAHSKGIAVIADVEFNHFTDRQGADKWIWNYDGDTKYNKGGIYFNGYNTPWGPAPDWSESRVVDYVEECCRYYLEELHVDGLRWDAPQHIKDKPNGWNAMRNILWNLQTNPGYEKKIFIAESLPYEKAVVESGNFDSGWWVQFHHSMEKALGGKDKGSSVEHGINGGDYSALYKRVIYALGHDEVRNGSQYLISEFGGRDDWNARAKRRLISALQFFIPGIPMIWQGEEFLQDGHFQDNEEHAVNWAYQTDTYGSQMQKMYQDALRIRRDFTSLRYGNLIWAHSQDSNRVLAFLRKDPVNGQTILVAVNFGDTDWIRNHSYGVSTGGTYGQWTQVFCSQDAAYGGWDGAGNAFYNPWTQEDGKVYLNLPRYGVIVMQLK